jgi:hypothetical protein
MDNANNPEVLAVVPLPSAEEREDDAPYRLSNL